MNQSIGETITAFRKQNKMSQKDLADALKEYGIYVKNATVSTWEKNINIPNAVQIFSICKVLGINNIYREFIGENPADPLTRLNDIGWEKLMDYANLLLLSDQYTKKTADIVPFRRMIPLSLQGTSAGTGDFMEDENFEMIEVGEDVPIKADFGVRLNGDSMEPQFHDDEIVWVQKSQNLRSGEIGIFYLDGMTYCKQLKKDQNGTFLISLNSEKYAPKAITAGSTFKVFGRVLC